MASAVSATAAPLRRVLRRSRRPEWLLLASSTALVLVLLASAEMGLRAAAPDDIVGPMAMVRLHRPSAIYGWEPRPGFSARIEGVRTSINRNRGRGAEIDPDAAGQRRILLLGDSIAFGSGVHDEQTFGALLDSDPGTSVLNLAVEGYGLDQTLVRLEREGLAFRPHTVVLSFCVANDFVDTALPAFLYDGSTPKPYFRVEDGSLRLHDEHLRRSLGDRALSRFADRLELVRWLQQRWRDAPAPTSPHWAEVAHRVLERPQEVLELTLRLLERTAAAARAGGADFVLLVHPNQRASRREGDALQSALLRSERLRDVPVVDLRERYEERGLAFRDVALDRVGHLSPAGHRAVADVLRGLLAAREERPAGGPQSRSQR